MNPDGSSLLSGRQYYARNSSSWNCKMTVRERLAHSGLAHGIRQAKANRMEYKKPNGSEGAF